MTETASPVSPDGTAGASRPAAPAPRRRIPYWLCIPIAMVMMFANYLPYLVLSLGLSLAKYKPGWTWSTIISILGGLAVLAAAVGFVWLLARYLLRTNLRGVGWTWTRDSWWLFVIGWALATVAVLVGTLAAHILRPSEVPPITSPDMGPWWAIALGILAGAVIGVAMQGIPEELLWRGWLMHALAERPRVALITSVFFFGCMHIISKGGQQNFGEQLLYVGQAMAFALLAGALALRLRSLWAAIGVHGGLHLTNLFLGMTPWSSQGPVTWIGEIVVYVGIALAVLATWKGTRVVMDR